MSAGALHADLEGAEEAIGAPELRAVGNQDESLWSLGIGAVCLIIMGAIVNLTILNK